MNPKNLEDIYELSPAQQGILFHSLYSPNSGVYFVHLCCLLQGELNLSAFECAWQRVIERHPILRTAFYWEDLEKPLQVVYQEAKLPLIQQDWCHLSSSQQQEQLEEFLQADRQQGFNLDQAPLMRLMLIQLAENTYQFVWSKHHLILDGWSSGLVLKEVFETYEALRQGQVLPSISGSSYGNYIEWLQQQDLSKAEIFWRQTLKGFLAPTNLRISREFGNLSEKENNYEQQQLTLSAATTTALQSFARQHHLTLNTIVQGIWALLLNRYSGEDDVVFGATVSGRPATLAGIESMVGLFINTLPVRVQVAPQESFLPWLQQLQNQLFEAREYEYSPLVQVQGWSDIPRGVSLFETLLVFENYPVDDSIKALLEAGDRITIQNVHSFEQTNYPLTVVVEVGLQLSIKITYDSNRFDSAAVNRLLGHLQTLLEDAIAQRCGCTIAHPNQRLSDFCLLTETEKSQLLVEWNNTQAHYPNHQCLHELFEAQVEKSPDAVAVVFEGQQFTYQELNQRANQLAHYLKKIGVESEVLVGICVERSLEMMVGLLGILKAGAAYVPLDPSYPEERLAFMIENSQVSVLVTQQSILESSLRNGSKNSNLNGNLNWVCLDTDWQIISQELTSNLALNVTVENLAYTIYTSGSTGKPKGVQVLHRSLVNCLSSMSRHPGLTDRDIFLSVTTLSFDIAALELFLPLIVGACVVIVSREVAADGTQLLKYLANSKATVMQATPATWRMLLAAGWQAQENYPSLKLEKILCGGEALPQELAEQLLLRSASVWNVYGPTETTIWSTIYPVKIESGSVPIGRAIANTQLYILDKHLHPVPVGIPGELHIGGIGVARGYLNRPDLTAEKFIPNPFSEQPESKIYKTGDLVRHLPDGNIEFLGRIDHQVKIRGFRIELGEIEAALTQHPDVREAVVLAREDEPNNKFLVAYIVPWGRHGNTAPTSPLSSTLLRSFLKEKLPDYMVPTAFVMLEALPLTPNGKVNRRALPAPNTVISERSVPFVAPRTPIEEKLSTIWHEVLGVEKISIHDNFFELGGHSLMATQIIAKVREAFQREISIRSLFEQPTIADFALAIEPTKNQNTAQSEATIAPISRQSRRIKLSSLTGTADASRNE